MITLHLASAPHVNLLVPSRANYADGFVEGIYVQGIFGKGYVNLHNHGQEKLIEIIQLTAGSRYGGLENAIVAGDSRIVIPGVSHGSLTEESYGQWMSIKVHVLQARYQHTATHDNKNLVYVFDTGSGPGYIATSDSLKRLHELLPNAAVILGVPLIGELKEGEHYSSQPTDDVSNLGRYVAILGMGLSKGM